MKLTIEACLHFNCEFTCYSRKDEKGTKQHTLNTGHRLFKTFPIPPGVLMATAPVLFDRIRWNVEEARLDSAVFDNHVANTQTIAVRLILSRTPRRG